MQNTSSLQNIKQCSKSIPAIILAGGQSQRLRLNSQYKWQLPFANNNTLLQYIIDKIKQQSKYVLINGPYSTIEDSNNELENQNLSQYALPIIRDKNPDFKGPLAGLLTGLYWAYENDHPWIMTLACDSPFFPDDLLAQLYLTSVILKQRHTINDSTEPLFHDKQAVTVSHDGQMHPTFGLWSTSLLPALEKKSKKATNERRSRSISFWAKQCAEVIEVTTSKNSTIIKDPFFNINTVEDYEEALTILKRL